MARWKVIEEHAYTLTFEPIDAETQEEARDVAASMDTDEGDEEERGTQRVIVENLDTGEVVELGCADDATDTMTPAQMRDTAQAIIETVLAAEQALRVADDFAIDGALHTVADDLIAIATYAKNIFDALKPVGEEPHP